MSDTTEPGYVLVASLSSTDATTTLFFGQLNDGPALRFVEPALRDRSHPIRTLLAELKLANPLAGASALVVVRGLFEFEAIARCAERLGIPRYFFLDDVPSAMQSVLDPLNASAQGFSAEAMRHRLKVYSGVLLSTDALVGYFREQRLHEHVMLYPPVAASPTAAARRDGALHVGFFGGGHRREFFARFVYPALARLAERQEVTVFAAGIDAGSDVTARLKVVPVSYEPSYPVALRQMTSYGIDVLVHPGPETADAIYKNPNVIINAQALGAVPIVSDVAPYRGLAAQGICVTCENTDASWFAALSSIAANRTARDLLISLGAAYCRHHFSGAANRDILTSLVGRGRVPTAWLRRMRLLPLTFGLSVGLVREFADRRRVLGGGQ